MVTVPTAKRQERTRVQGPGARYTTQPLVSGGIAPAYNKAYGKSQSPQFRTTSASPARAAQAGKTLQQAGRAFEEIALRQQEILLKSLDVSFSESVRSVLHGEDGQGGYMNTRGTAAIGQYDASRESIAKARKELLEKAGHNPRVRRRLTLAITGREGDAYTMMARHNNNEQRRVATALSQARIDNAVEEASYNPDKLGTALGVIQSETRSALAAQGLATPETIEAQTRKASSEAVQMAIGAQINEGNLEKAAELMDNYGQSYMTASDRNRASLAIAKAEESRMVDGLVNDLWARHEAGDLSASEFDDEIRKVTDDPGTMESVMSNLRKWVTFDQGQRDREDYDEGFNTVDAGTTRDEILDILDDDSRSIRERKAARDKLAMLDAAAETQKRQAHREAVDFFEQGIKGGQDPFKLMSDNPGFAELVDAGDIERLNKLAKLYAEGQRHASVSDGETLDNLLSLPPRDLAEIVPGSYDGVLTPDEADKLAKAQRNAAGQPTVPSQLQADMRRKLGNIMGRIGQGSNTRERKELTWFENELMLRTEEFMSDQGRVPNEQEKNDIVSRLTVEGSRTRKLLFVDSLYPDASVNLYEASQMEDRQLMKSFIDIGQVPDIERKKIEQAARQGGFKGAGNIPDKVIGNVYLLLELGKVDMAKRALGID